MKAKLVFFLLCLVMCTLSGCVGVPAPSEQETISDHIEFLTKPALQGRAARSSQSRYVRKYLIDRLAQYGLEPWPGMGRYQHDFGFGKNVIGVLPGSDPELASQIVLVSAHYDHLPPKGRQYYPGAADNASGVAVLLDMIRTFSQMEDQPKRSIAFAFFDAEEEGLIGSFAFTLHEYYDDEKVVAVINVDMLGRKFLDIIEDSLILAVDAHYPHLYRHIEQFSTNQRLNLLPLRSDIVGAVADHIPFTIAQRPVLFFTCGWFSDYHKPTDTADKLMMEKLHRQAKVIEQTVVKIANAEPQHLQPDRNKPVNTLDSLAFIIEAITDNAEVLELNSEAIEALDLLAAKARRISAEPFSSRHLDHKSQIRNEVMKTVQDSAITLMPSIESFLWMADVYSAMPEPVTKMYREMIRYYLENRPGLFGQNKFSYAEDVPIAQSPWRLQHIGGDEYIFALLDLKISAAVNMDLRGCTTFAIGLDFDVYRFRGRMGQIIDYILLQSFLDGPWPSVRGSVDRGPVGGLPEFKTADSAEKAEQWIQLVDIVANMSAEQYPAFERMLFDSDDTGWNQYWLLGLIESENPSLASQAVRAAGQEFPDEIKSFCVKVLTDPAADQLVRWAALEVLAAKKSSAGLYAMAEALSDTTEIDLEAVFAIDRDFPFSTNPFWSPFIDGYHESITDAGASCFGSEIVYGYLKSATGQDYGLDQYAWREWIEQAGY